MKTDVQKTTGTYSLIMVNLQEAIVMNENGAILAGCVKHKNMIAYNKPLLCDADRRNDVLEMFTASGWIDKNTMKLVQTDSFSMGFWNVAEQETTLLN